MNNRWSSPIRAYSSGPSDVPRPPDAARQVRLAAAARRWKCVSRAFRKALDVPRPPRQELERLGAGVGADHTTKARAEAEALMTQTRADADRLREEMRQKAKAEAEGIMRNAERQIQLETASHPKQIRAEAVDLSRRSPRRFFSATSRRETAPHRRRAQTGRNARQLGRCRSSGVSPRVRRHRPA